LSRAIPFQDRGRGTPTERRATTFFYALASISPDWRIAVLCGYDAEMEPLSDLPRRRGVVAVVMRGERFLVIRRSQHVRAPGMHCFPGGAIEPGESEPEAVRREMLEELAVEATAQRLLWRSVTPWNVELAWWVAQIDKDVQPVANPLEVEAFFWLTATDIRSLPNLLASNAEFLDAWESGRLAQMPS
jgi:8-oxo-dGTP diphosphatase